MSYVGKVLVKVSEYWGDEAGNLVIICGEDGGYFDYRYIPFGVIDRYNGCHQIAVRWNVNKIGRDFRVIK